MRTNGLNEACADCGAPAGYLCRNTQAAVLDAAALIYTACRAVVRGPGADRGGEAIARRVRPLIDAIARVQGNRPAGNYMTPADARLILAAACRMSLEQLEGGT